MTTQWNPDKKRVQASIVSNARLPSKHIIMTGFASSF